MINVELEFFIPYELCYKYGLLDSGIDKKILVMTAVGKNSDEFEQLSLSDSPFYWNCGNLIRRKNVKQK